jgi:osmotically inducible lipoprotein OsmB
MKGLLSDGARFPTNERGLGVNLNPRHDNLPFIPGSGCMVHSGRTFTCVRRSHVLTRPRLPTIFTYMSIYSNWAARERIEGWPIPRERSLKEVAMTRLLMLFVVVAAFSVYSCATDQGYNTQKGAAIGAIGGALAGQAIGRNTGGTLIGAAVGGLAGAIAGNAVDQNEARKASGAPPRAVPPSYGSDDAPPGQWVVVPGQWVGGRWVPSHRAWVPMNP